MLQRSSASIPELLELEPQYAASVHMSTFHQRPQVLPLREDNEGRGEQIRLWICQGWKALEEEAREARRGLWSMSNPIPPWEFRRNRR